jgi:hypothetical protein
MNIENKNDYQFLENAITIVSLPKNTEVDDDKIWKGFKFPAGAFMVWSIDGRVAYGKCDPLTLEILEWNERNIDEPWINKTREEM